MASSNQPSARFRAATEFPKSIEQLSQTEVSQLYQEMRECLIFTNRSRGQLIRRNEEHKQAALQLKVDFERLQSFINRLNFEKQQLAENNQQVVAELQQEITAMSTHLEQLSTAFDTVADIESSPQSQWGFLALPSRFFNFFRSVRAIVTWWRDEQGPATTNSVDSQASRPSLPGQTEAEDSRNEKPQMHDDQSSIGRSLLDR